jgi:hypothetical protein
MCMLETDSIANLSLSNFLSVSNLTFATYSSYAMLRRLEELCALSAAREPVAHLVSKGGFGRAPFAPPLVARRTCRRGLRA